MARQLRRTLGSITDEGMVALMRQIQTQSVQTISRWCIGYAATYYLPIYERLAREAGIQDVQNMESVMTVADGYLEGAFTRAQLKSAITLGRQIARATLFSPVAQAAARACSVAASVPVSPTSSLGMCGYGAAAVAYDELGTQATAQAYDERAQREFARLLASLVDQSVDGEPHPADIDWNC